MGWGGVGWEGQLGQQAAAPTADWPSQHASMHACLRVLTVSSCSTHPPTHPPTHLDVVVKAQGGHGPDQVVAVDRLAPLTLALVAGPAAQRSAGADEGVAGLRFSDALPTPNRLFHQWLEEGAASARALCCVQPPRQQLTRW